MTEHSIATIINYCSNEYRFLGHCVKEAAHFSNQIIVPVSDHFFDGSPEVKEELQAVFQEFPQCQFILYPFDPEKLPHPYRQQSQDPHFWHSLSRYLAYRYVPKDTEYLLFLDVDEIIEGKKFSQFLDVFPYRDYEGFRLANFWYFREPSFQAEQWEDTSVFVKRSLLTRKCLLHKEERNAIYDRISGKKKRYVTSMEGLPMIHHYSWVRSKEEMLKKVSSWGHKKDQDWVSLVEKEFSHEFDGEDFIHHYEYKKVHPFVKIDVKKKPEISLGANSLVLLNVHTLNSSQLKKLLKENFFKKNFQKVSIGFKRALQKAKELFKIKKSIS